MDVFGIFWGKFEAKKETDCPPLIPLSVLADLSDPRIVLVSMV
jgi:hypothetical protein